MINPMTDLKPTFEKLYPEGSKGGQCGVFAHKLVEFPLVGDTLASKTATVKKFGLMASQIMGTFQPGDVVITSESLKNGHVFVVNAIINDSLRCTEANYNNDEKVHHTRLIPKFSTKIIGLLRGPLKVKILNSMETMKITIADNIHWPDMPAQVQQFADLVKLWSNNRLTVSCETVQTTFLTSAIPLETYAEIFKGPTHDWLHANLNPLRNNADAIIFNLGPADQIAEQGYMLDPDQVGGPFYLMLTTGISEMFRHDVGFTEFTKLCLHELSHCLYHITGQVDTTHQNDYQNPSNLQEAYATLDYGRLSTNLALRRQQKEQTPMAKFYKVDDHGKLGIMVVEGLTGIILFEDKMTDYLTLQAITSDAFKNAPTVKLP